MIEHLPRHHWCVSLLWFGRRYPCACQPHLARTKWTRAGLYGRFKAWEKRDGRIANPEWGLKVHLKITNLVVFYLCRRWRLFIFLRTEFLATFPFGWLSVGFEEKGGCSRSVIRGFIAIFGSPFELTPWRLIDSVSWQSSGRRRASIGLIHCGDIMTLSSILWLMTCVSEHSGDGVLSTAKRLSPHSATEPRFHRIEWSTGR